MFVQNKTIKAYPWDTIVKLNKGGAARDPVVCSIAFSTFNEVSVKSKVMFNMGPSFFFFSLAMCMLSLFDSTSQLQVLSVYEMFGRHLINLPNCSAEKAAAILEKYPTISQ